LFASVSVFVHLGIHGFEVILKRPLEVIFNAFHLTLISVCAVRANEYEERYHKRLSTALPPNLRTGVSVARIFREVTPFIFVIGFIAKNETYLLYIVDNVGNVSLLAGLYFLACRPLPPRQKRVAKLKVAPA
jgi:hypothetical protein